MKVGTADRELPMPFPVVVRPCPSVKVQNAWSEPSRRCGSALPRPDRWSFPADQGRGALPAWQPSSAVVGIGQGHGCSVAGCDLAAGEEFQAGSGPGDGGENLGPVSPEQGRQRRVGLLRHESGRYDLAWRRRLPVERDVHQELRFGRRAESLEECAGAQAVPHFRGHGGLRRPCAREASLLPELKGHRTSEKVHDLERIGRP